MTSFRSIIREWRCIPQILTSDPEDFLDTAVKLKEYGYTEVNLNLGCPSGTVQPREKAPGFKRYWKACQVLRRGQWGNGTGKSSFFHQDPCGCGKWRRVSDSFRSVQPVPINRTYHPPKSIKRFYKYNVRMNAFKEGFEKSRHSVCYNGDIFRRKDYDRLVKEYPDLE